MSRPQVKRQRVRPTREESRRKVLDAAARVFAARGIADATLDEVAADAGMTKGAIYSSFAGKDDLVYALMNEHIGARTRAATARSDDHADASDAVMSAGAALVEASNRDEDWQRLFIEFWLRAQRDASVGAEFAARRKLARAELARYVAAESERRGVTSLFTPDELAVTLLALSNGLALERLTDLASVPDDLLPRLLERLALPRDEDQ